MEGEGEQRRQGEKRSYKTKYQVQIMLAEMEYQICSSKRDHEIMEFLDLKERSFYYFKKKLYEQSLALQTAKKTDEVLAFETRILKERLTKVYQHLEERLTMINEDPKVTDNIAEIAIAAFEVAKNIMTLELEGLRALSSINENKFLRFVNRTYENYNNNDNSNILQP